MPSPPHVSRHPNRFDRIEQGVLKRRKPLNPLTDGHDNAKSEHRKGNEVQVHAVHWADARSATVDVRWTGTGLSFWEISQIRIYSWPVDTLVQVHEDVE